MSISKSLTFNMLFLLTVIIRGFAFVEQRTGMEHFGPFTFNGIRFLLGSLTLLPLLALQNKSRGKSGI
ncbi:MAG: EamA family transporter [Bacteroidales bacterium]|nr:EamA family transporter [Bacteroidales bacterium]